MSGTSVLDLQNSKVDNIVLNSFAATGTPTLKIDISPNTLTLDNIAATTGSGSVATNFNILNDALVLTPQELTVLSSGNNGISLSLFDDVLINTTDYIYRISHSDNIGKILLTGEYQDGLRTALLKTGTRSYAQTDEYSAYMNLPAMNKGTLNISGTGILNGDGTYSLFAVDSTSSADTWNLNISDVTIKNWTAVDGGALNIKGENSTVVIDNVTFDNNIATGGLGGAIYNDGGTLTITDSEFYNNKTTLTTNYQGGAIYNTGATGELTITGSTFGKRTGSGTVEDPYVYSDGNETMYGGAIYNTSALNNIITDSKFYGNLAYAQGGAIGNSGTLTVSDTEFFNNQGFSYGGAIHNTGTLNINNSIFCNNSGYGNGGAIYNNNGILNITGSEFYNNHGSISGAIHNTGATAELTITDSTFGKRTGSGTEADPYVYSDGNTSSNGGAIDNASNITITNSKFYGNTTSSQGGAIYNYGGTSTINGSEFAGNQASVGGAINNTGTLTINNSTFTDNTASVGGAIYNSGNLTINDNVIFSNNTSNTPGGAILNEVGGTLIINGTSIFSGNTATNTGGAIYNSGTLTISGTSIFSGNTATSKGGAILNEGGGTLTISGTSIFSGNTATNTGGAIYNTGTLSLIADSGNIEFTDNKANSVSNAIHTNGGTVNLSAGAGKSITFNDAITSENTTSIMNINNNATYNTGSVILNADMSGYLGAVNLFGGTLQLTNSATFFGSSSDFAMSGTSVLDLQNNKIDNIALNSFAAAGTPTLKIDISPNTLTLDNIAVTTGSGSLATNFNILNDAEILEKTELTLLSSGNNGISLQDFSDITINTTNYTYTIAHSDNIGKILLNSITGNNLERALKTIGNRSYVQTNEYSATSNLPAMSRGTLNISGIGTINGNNLYSLFNVNSTGSTGPEQTWNLNISDITIKNGLAANGGAINVAGERSTVTIDGVTFENNIGASSGGAISNNDGTVTVSDSTFNQNISSQGGAISNSGTLTVNGNTIFTNNTALSQGGAIYNTGTLNLVADTGNIEFTGNSTSSVSNAIHTNGGTVNLNAGTGHAIIFNDSITSENTTSIMNINNGATNNTGSVILNADMSGYTGAINLFGGTLKVDSSGTFFGSSSNAVDFYMANNSTLDLQNSKIDNIFLDNYSGAGNIKIDTDLNLSLTDNITAANVLAGSSINISAIKLLSDKTADQSLKVLSSNIDMEDFTMSVTTSTHKYTVTKDASNAGYIKITYQGSITDGLIPQLNATGLRSYTQTAEIYTANVNLPAMNAIGGVTNKLTVFGEGKTFSGDNKFSMFNVDTTIADKAPGVARELVIENTNIADAKGANGSALNVKGTGAQATLNNVSFTANQSTSNGGAVNVGAGGDVTINGGTLKNNTAGGKGGAIYLQGDSTNAATVTIISNAQDTTLYNNMANGVNNSIAMGGDAVLNINNSTTHKLNSTTAIATSGSNNILNINKAIGAAPVNGSFDIDKDYSVFNGSSNTVNLFNGSLNLKNAGTFFGNTDVNSDAVNFSMHNNSILNLQNSKIDTILVNNFSASGSPTLRLDIDLTNHVADRLIAINASEPTVNIDTFNILSTAVTDRDFQVVSSNLIADYIGISEYYTTDYKFNITNGSTSDSVRFKSVFIGGDGLIRTLVNIGQRTYSMTIDSQGKPETYIANKNLPEMNAEYAPGRINKATIFGNGGTISGAGSYSLFKVDTSDDVERIMDMENVTLTKAYSSGNGAALNVNGDKANINITNTAFTNNTSSGSGGAISVTNGAQVNMTGAMQFNNNHSAGKGGAVYMKGNASNNSVINLSAKNSNVSFSGNNQSSGSNAIYMDGNATLNLNVENTENAAIVFNDSIESANAGNVININKPTAEGVASTGKVVMNADMGKYTGAMNVHNGTLNFAQNDMTFNTSAFNVHQNALLDMRNNQIGSLMINNLNLVDSKMHFGIDIDAARERADTIEAPGASGSLILGNNVNIISDTKIAKSGPITISKTSGLNVITNPSLEYMGPVYKYTLSNANGQNIILSRTDALNPMVLEGTISTVSGVLTNQMHSYDQAFSNTDVVMFTPSFERQAMKARNKTAVLEGNVIYNPIMNSAETGGIWFKPYSTLEKVGLIDGPDVNNFVYGALIIGQTPLKELGHGLQGSWGGYIGYNGSSQSYDGVRIIQNGGLLGLTRTIYKGKFFTSLTLNAGASAAAASDATGRDEFTIITGGVANKTGYNIEFADGKYILQPNILLSYSFIKNSNFTSHTGSRISSDALNVLQINPGFKLIGNMGNSWQPYVSAGVVWNLMNNPNFMVNDIDIPKVGIAPYAEYGIGVQKTFGERLTGYAQTMVRSGGKNGVAFQWSIKWSF
ncbi:MAG: hypothetical protein PHF89_04825 [Eubacteriales bacterium]|nr:hypothetical protein [Eubacteriales bacterium]